MAIDHDRELNQGQGAADLVDTGETRMWNAEEVREAAEIAAAEWDARAAAEETAEQDAYAAQTSAEDMNRSGDVNLGENDAYTSQEQPDAASEANVLDIPMMTNGQMYGGAQDVPGGDGGPHADGSDEAPADGGRKKRGKKGKKAHGKAEGQQGRGKAAGGRQQVRGKAADGASRGKRSRGALVARIVLGVAVAGILGTGAYYGWRYYSEEILPGRQYAHATELRDGGALDDAIQVFTRLGEWGDAPEQVLITELMKARNQMDVGAYEDALVTLAAVGDYEGTDELVTQDLLDEANQALSDIAYNKGTDLIKLYDYDAAADQFKASQAYMEREDAAELQEACENAYDEVYVSSFAEGRDADEDLQMTMYLWVHSVITPGESTVPLGMQSDLSTGSVNSSTYGQAYMNYVYYSEQNESIFLFSYAGSEKDANDESRQVFLMAEFSDDYEQVTTSKVYADTGEVPAAPDIRLWNCVTDEETVNAVQDGIRTRLTMDLIASGELDAETYGGADHSFDAIATIDDGFTLKTSEEIAAEQAAAEAEAAAQSDEDAASEDASRTVDEETLAVLQASAEAEPADESDDDSGDASDDGDDSDENDEESDESANTDSDDSKSSDDADENDDEADAADTHELTEEDKKARAAELEQQQEDERLAAQQAAVDGLHSDYAIMVDAATGEILVSKDADTRMYPASMTKIMTILVAAENVTDLTQRAEITNDIINYASERELTTVGWSSGEEVTAADLMWGTALCSGADAAKALANYVAGSETNYVDLMNAKVEELGLGGTHFANCTGVYSDDNYTTPHDMALILYAAVQNPLARTVLSTRQYTTTFTEEHPAGITITNAFLRNMDQDQLPGVVLSAKTGFVSQSMFCAASYMIADDGEVYICVTGHADSSAHCRADHASLYSAFAAPPSHTDMEKYLEEILAGESSNVAAIDAAGGGSDDAPDDAE